MLYLAWDREINIALFFCDVFVWKWGLRPWTSSRCYNGNKSAATFNPPWVPNCMQNLKGGWKFSFPKMFDSYRDLFLNVRKMWRGNQVPFMTEQWRKSIRNRNKLWKKFTHDRTNANIALYQKQYHKCTSLRRKAIKAYFLNKSETENLNSFWNTYRPFLQSKRSRQANDISLEQTRHLSQRKKWDSNTYLIMSQIQKQR